MVVVGCGLDDLVNERNFSFHFLKIRIHREGSDDGWMDGWKDGMEMYIRTL